MTHDNIYTKFMIEYDKANITSSYPSLTKYEIATLLDKALLAFVSQKITGNNPRRATFEVDSKSIEDIRPLITSSVQQYNDDYKTVENEVVFDIPAGFMYYVSGMCSNTPVYIIGHDDATKFMKTDINDPWIKNPVCYFEGNTIRVLFGHNTVAPTEFRVTYIKLPIKFVDNINTDTQFELSDSAAEEIINLAVLFATEITESPRQQTKSQLIPLES